MVISPVVTVISVCIEGVSIVVNLDEWFFPLQQFWFVPIIYAPSVKLVQLLDKLFSAFY